MLRQSCLVTFFSFVLTAWTSPLFASDPAPSSFRGNVAPLLEARCVRCHGEKVRKADLDLRSAAGVLKGGESGAAVVAGKPDKSLLYEKVHEGEMPPEEGKRLRESEVEMIRRWIADGARIEPSDVTQIAVTQHDVIPIVLRRCTVCHGQHRQEDGLDLRTKAAMLRGGKSGPAIVPGKPDESLLIKKIAAGQMPPPDATGRSERQADRDGRARHSYSLDRGRRAGSGDRAGCRDDDARSARHRQGSRLLGLPAAAASDGSGRARSPRVSAIRSMPSSCKSWRPRD